MISGGGGEETPVPPPPGPGRAGALRRRLDRVPLRWRRVVLLGVLTGYLAAAHVVMLWLFSLVEDDPVAWTAPLPGLVGGFLGSAAVVSLWRRPIRGAVTHDRLEGALRDGRLPEDAEPEPWALVLGDELADLRARRTAGVATMVLLAACSAGLTLVVDPAWIGVLLSAAALACAAWARWAGLRRERRIRRLLDQVSGPVPPAG